MGKHQQWVWLSEQNKLVIVPLGGGAKNVKGLFRNIITDSINFIPQLMTGLLGGL